MIFFSYYLLPTAADDPEKVSEKGEGERRWRRCQEKVSGEGEGRRCQEKVEKVGEGVREGVSVDI